MKMSPHVIRNIQSHRLITSMDLILKPTTIKIFLYWLSLPVHLIYILFNTLSEKINISNGMVLINQILESEICESILINIIKDIIRAG